MTSSSRSTSRRSEGQTFLVGSTLYLRGIENDDTKLATAWFPSRYPLAPDILEERLKESVSDDAKDSSYRLVACRRDDDMPVGSAAFQIMDGRTAEFSVFTNPHLLESVRGEIAAELIGLMVPYLLMERDLMVVWFETGAGIPAIAHAVADAGMYKAYRLREALLIRGQRYDQVCYEIVHPAWVARLGSPAIVAEGEVAREVRSPAPRVFPQIAGDPPENATMVGERVYIRAIVDDDADEFAYWTAREPETFFDNGRPMRSPVSVAGFHRKPVSYTHLTLPTKRIV